MPRNITDSYGGPKDEDERCQEKFAVRADVQRMCDIFEVDEHDGTDGLCCSTTTADIVMVSFFCLRVSFSVCRFLLQHISNQNQKNIHIKKNERQQTKYKERNPLPPNNNPASTNKIRRENNDYPT